MRTLALSIGNTSLLAGEFRGAKLLSITRVPLKADFPWQTAATVLAPKLRDAIDRAVLCSVVPAHTKRAIQLIRKEWGIAPHLLTHDSDHGLRIGYTEPHRLGLDRLAAAIGARTRFPNRHVITVDFGTATTVTALRRDGTIVGGAILPGLALWGELLAKRTALLPQVALQRPKTPLGRSPEAAIEAGIFFGHAGAVRELVTRISREAFGRAKPVVLGTGGHAPLFAREKLFTVHAPDLILQGLRAYADRFDAAETAG